MTYGCDKDARIMSRPARQLAAILDLDPGEAAGELVADKGERWLDAFAAELDRRRAGASLARTLTVWQLTQSDAARLFGVSRQAVSKWLELGVPAERAEVVADLAAATDLLVHYLKRDRIPAVVRRAVPTLENRSLLDLLAAGQSPRMLEACRDMFAFDRAQS